MNRPGSQPMKRVLIITYYWPPSGGGGVMRWLKMSKYLPELGWQPVIYTPENPDPSVRDESLLREIHPLTEIIRTPIREPYSIYRRLTGKKKSAEFKAGYIAEASRGNRKERVAVFLRGNLLIPDPRVFWVRPSVRFLKKYLKENPVDLIVSTGPPHSMHLIAAGIKKQYSDTPWMADFRDPWTEIDFYHRLKLTPLADKIHRALEKKILTTADIVTTVSPYLQASTEKLAGRKIDLLYNGFDPEDFNLTEKPDKTYFTISHYGAFNRDRNPDSLWQALGKLIRENAEFARKLRIQLIGQTDESIIRNAEIAGLKNNLVMHDHISHKSGLKLLAGSHMLLLPLNQAPHVKGILPGKMYEYMALKRPILAIGPPDGDFAGIIREAGAGYICDFADTVGIQSAILVVFEDFQKGSTRIYSANMDRFSRKNLAREMIGLAFQQPVI